MIMQGTTPRALSWTGLLAMFGLSAFCLPLSPTWARADDEPERKQERSIVVIQGDGDEDSGERNKTLNIRYVVTRSEDEQDDEVSVKPKPKESKRGTSREKQTVDEIVAQIHKKLEAERATKGGNRSIDELRAAMLDKMEAELKKFAKEAIRSQGESEQAHRKLEEALSKISEDGGMKLLLQKKMRDLKTFQDGPVPAERKKEIAEAMARVDKARAQLREAEAQLAKLRGAGFMTARIVPARPPVPPRPFVSRGDIEYRPAVIAPHSSDRRIDELERKLDRLVDEIKSLREERGKTK